MRVHLVDGTYELFRHYFAVPSAAATDGTEIAAARGVAFSVLSMLEAGATHLGVATDHVIESFRNDMWPGYKTGVDVEPELLAQFPIVEEALEAVGVVVWRMEEYEADDGMASVAAAVADEAEQVLICTPDKDLSQCVVGQHIVQFDRRANKIFDEAGVIEKFGVPPASIPDYLALVGDSADGFPGLPGWGAKSAAAVLARYGHLEDIPVDVETWEVSVRSAKKLADTLADQIDDALLFKDLATLRADLPLVKSVDDLEWRGPAEGISKMADFLRAPALEERAKRLAEDR
ncbi:MAG: flap endonuclease [Chloroflexi bacterium]|nr:flap endonuclease [Chloroflexota bacterium]